VRFVLLFAACAASSTDITCPGCPRSGSTGTTSGGTGGTTSGGTTGTVGVDAGAPDLSPATCDPVAQTGCPETQKCQGDGTCADLPPRALGLGILCGASETPPVMGDDCSGGELCVPMGGWDLCKQPCSATVSCVQPTYVGGLPPYCAYVTGQSYGACTVSCDPVGATKGCGAGLVCYAQRTGAGDIVTDCLPPGSGTAGATCVNQYPDCGPGMLCLNMRCTPICHPAKSGECATGTCITLPDGNYG